ncbi:LOW QUALITY PROTEIN: hypothetical protein OSB04_012618 [Centaurea solstitialis]|uniref:Uncharacterized protein n=1 Tax=Centaurea solstitialis TaxID=347529 RepID=A0AA38WQ48_9ASTR|nr:LOW QUALITY PROTEIN: hypothetical protein OSB04_012618 [Centaurea solstitialis]
MNLHLRMIISFVAKETDLVEWKGDIRAMGVIEKGTTKDANSKFQNSILKKLDSQETRFSIKWIICLSRKTSLERLDSQLIIRIAGLGSKRAFQAINVAFAITSSNGLTPEMKLATTSAIAM